MNNIRQNFIKFIISFCCFVLVSACQSESDNNRKKSSKHAVEIAILVPLSGENELMGRQYSGLIKMGLASSAKAPIRVTSYDSANEFKLKESLGKIFEQRACIIIGPIYSQETKLLANMIKDRNDITVLSLSNDPTLADNNIFVFGHAPMSQIHQMADYLLDNEYKNYIILMPASRNSTTVSTILQNMITTKGGVVNKVELYGNSDEELAKSVKDVSDLVDSLNEQEENLKQPVIMIGDDTEGLRKLYKIAKGFNLDKKAVIAGDNRLDINSEEQLDFIFTGSIKISNNKLRQKIAQAGINNLSFMHALAYDAGNLVANYIGESYSQESFLHKFISQEQIYGLSGKVYFLDSIAKRQYDIVRKHDGEYMIFSDK